jgi:hypothetical protein
MPVIREMCPWATERSDLLPRDSDSRGTQREADVFCYTRGDTLTPCNSVPSHGVELAACPPGTSPLPPLPAPPLPAGEAFSPFAPSRRGPHKYFIGEAYSGASEQRVKDKVTQLETLLGTLLGRWNDRHGHHVAGGGATDITEVVGAAALILSAGGLRQQAELTAARSVVETALLETRPPPHLLRLARAGRLLVVVLDKRRSPATYASRAVHARLDRLERTIQQGLQGLAQLITGVDVSADSLALSQPRES